MEQPRSPTQTQSYRCFVLMENNFPYTINGTPQGHYDQSVGKRIEIRMEETFQQHASPLEAFGFTATTGHRTFSDGENESRNLLC